MSQGLRIGGTGGPLIPTFAHVPLDALPQPRRAGIWCAMHGESMLEAGLNHIVYSGHPSFYSQMQQ